MVKEDGDHRVSHDHPHLRPASPVVSQTGLKQQAVVAVSPIYLIERCDHTQADELLQCLTIWHCYTGLKHRHACGYDWYLAVSFMSLVAHTDVIVARTASPKVPFDPLLHDFKL